MNKPQPKIDAELGTAGTDEASVADFLSRHTDFFERHPALLAQLKIPHARGDSSTISLVERQVDLLRERGAPFAFATGYGDAGLRDVDRGTPVLQKPFRESDLARVIGELRAKVG
jgi:hypothetical protein